MLHSMAVKDYMSASLVTFSKDMDVMTAMTKLLNNGVSGAPVVDRLGNIIGVLSERDCMKVAMTAGYHEELGGRVSEFMSTDPVTVDTEASILDVAKMFLNAPFKLYPVVNDDNRLVGQITRSDVLRAIQKTAD